MPKVLVLFHSRTGRTAAVADAIAEGATSVKFTEVDVRRIRDIAPDDGSQTNTDLEKSRERLSKKYKILDSVDDLPNYDGIILGSPERFGVLSAEVKTVLDECTPLGSTGALVDKVGSAFATAMTPHGGNETTIQSILVPLLHLGMIVVAPGYANFESGNAVSRGDAPTATGLTSPTEVALTAARHQGARVAKVVEWVRHAKSHEKGHSHQLAR